MTTIALGSYADFKLVVDKLKCDRFVVWSADPPGNPNAFFSLTGFNDSGTSAVNLGYNLGVGDPVSVIPPTLMTDFPHAVETEHSVTPR